MRNLNNTSNTLNLNHSIQSNTNIEEVKRLNAQSGLTYNEVLALLGKNYLESQKRK